MPKAFRIIGMVLVVGGIGALIALSIITLQNRAAEDFETRVWDEQMTMGNLDAENHFVMYTDLACPYCDVFARELIENEEKFVKEYVEGQNVLWEVRLTSFLNAYGEHKSEMSLWSAEGAYCAKREGKFWDYYHAAVKSLWEDYHSKGIGNSKNAPMIKDMTADYWKKIGHEVGLGEKFDQCFDNHETRAEINEVNEKTAEELQRAGGGGMPFFKFNNFIQSGFDPSWDWDYVEMYLKSGLRK